MSTISASTTSTTAFKITTDTTGTLVFQTGASPTTALTLDTSQNMGLGVVPSAWGANYKAFDIKRGSVFQNSTLNWAGLSNNAYNDGTNWIYKESTIARMFRIQNDQFEWFTAPSGTAGNAITFTQAMTLDANGRLGVARTSPGAQLDVLGAASTSAMRIVGNSGASIYVDLSGGGDNYYDATNNIFRNASGTERARIDSSGTLSLGVTPQTWTSLTPLQIKNAAFCGFTSGTTYISYVGSNWYYNSGDKYIGNGYATVYTQNNGTHNWFTSASGTAGNAITFNQAMLLDAGGRRTNPLQPGFLAYGLGVGSFNSGTGAAACLKGGTLRYNVGSGYDTTTGRFTAPVAGTYVFMAAILVESGTGRMEAALFINGSGTSLIALNGSGTTYDGPMLSATVNLAQNDYVTIGRVSGTAYSSPHPNTYFSAYLLG